MNPEPKLPLKFPKNFLWGASSSAHQIEGDTHNQWTIWELAHAQVLAQTAKYRTNYLPKWDDIQDQATDPANYISGMAAGHYNNYKQDFALLKKMNMNAWRFSIEWSRVEPKEGVWDAAAIEHYRIYLQQLQRLGIEPIVTLWHWTVPVWFEEKGGFTVAKNVDFFVRFAAKIFEELGREFRYVITLNEPEVYVAKSFVVGDWPPQRRSRVQAFLVLLHLIGAHKKVYKLAKRAGRKYLVSIAKNSIHHYAGDDAKLSQLTAGLAQWGSDTFLLRRLRRHMDFIGLNYYFSNRYYGYRMHNANEQVNDLGWEMRPGDIETVLKDLSDRYDLPIIVTENGLADRDDEFRKWWISQTLMAMNRALQSGVQLQGYLHWSLTDNFEWADGFWPRFGLAAVDYETGKRTLRPSAVWFAGIIKRLRQL